MTIYPTVAMFPPPPLAQVTPFTFREGATLVYKLNILQRWLLETLIPYVEESDKVQRDWLVKQLEEMNRVIEQNKSDWDIKFEEMKNDLSQVLAELNDSAVALLVDSALSNTFAAIDRHFVANNELVVNVMDHGAKGDGVTDDRDAVMRALNVIAANKGGTLFFPAGKTFWWPRIVSLEPKHSNMRVLGYGARIGKKNVSDNNYAIFSMKSMGARGYGSGVRNVSFEGIEFFGDLTINRDACAVAANHAENISFLNCNFIGMHHNGHIVDLGGCRNVYFENCVFAGTGSGRVGNYIRAEAIQIDISAAGAASAPDEPGSWSGLPTINVHVRNCKFLPLVIGGVKYAAPKPIGSHARREAAWYENINFESNYIEDPIFDATSDTPGDVHFVCARNINVKNNTWRLTTPASHIAIGFYSTDRGTPQNANNEDGGTVNEVIEIRPMPITDVEVSGNKFYGFGGGTLDRGYVQVKNFNNNFKTVVATNIKVHDNHYESLAVGAGIHAVLVEDATNVQVHGDSVVGKARALQARRLRNLTVIGESTVDPGTQSINITDCNGFTVTSNALLSGGSLPCILVNEGSSNGIVTGNVFAGNSSSPTLIAGANVIAKDNIISE